MSASSTSAIDGSALMARAQERRQEASALLDDLAVMEGLGTLGRAVLVGSVRHGLVVLPDIDIEVAVPELWPGIGFEVVGQIARHETVTRVSYANRIADRGWVTWDVDVSGPSMAWTLEIYLGGPDDPYAGWSERLAGAFDATLDDEQRAAILAIKEAHSADEGYRSIDVYRAVCDAGIRTESDYADWLVDNRAEGLVDWVPRAFARDGSDPGFTSPDD